MDDCRARFYNGHTAITRQLNQRITMGCRVVRGETIYFVRQAGRTAGEIDGEWFGDGVDARLLPPVFTCLDGQVGLGGSPAAVPIEICSFEGS
jgi:hypothetical protein